MDIKLKAKEYAIKAHVNQVIKSDTSKPKVTHSINVAYILEQYGLDDNLIAAGYLHDVIEDTEKTYEDILKEFGKDVAKLVLNVSEPDKSLSWEDRKNYTINNCSKLDLRTKLLMAADKVNILEDIERLMYFNENFTFDIFNQGYEKQKWYYTSIYEEISKKENHKIFERLNEVVKRVFYQEKDISKEYLDSDKHSKLLKFHYLKYEINSILNCIDNKPYVIEFTGTPRTGKTSIINNLSDFLKKSGLKVKVLEEFTTSKFYKENIKSKLKDQYKNVVNLEIPKYVNEQLDDAISSNYDIVIIDRSLFDRCIWIDRLKLKQGITEKEVKDYYDKYIPYIKNKINLVIATYCNFKTAIKRDYEANLSLEKRTFLNEINVNEYNISLKNTVSLLKDNNYLIGFFDTENQSLKDCEYTITEYILNNMKDHFSNEMKKYFDRTI